MATIYGWSVLVRLDESATSSVRVSPRRNVHDGPRVTPSDAVGEYRMLALGLETHATRSLPLDVDYENGGGPVQ